MAETNTPLKGPRSLLQMCKEVCIRNLPQITDLGDLSYELIKDVLEKIHNANQLRLIEANSPQIRDETEWLWRALIRRKFPSESALHRYEPDEEEGETWADVYDKYDFEQKQKDAEAEARLRMAFSGLKNQKEQSVTKIVSAKSLPNIKKVTRNGNGIGARKAGGPSGSSRLAFGGGSRTTSIIQKARREAREAANRRQLSTPSGNLRVQPGQIKAAPEAMVNDHRISNQPSVRIIAPVKNKTKHALDDDDLFSKEERLRQAKKAKVAATSVEEPKPTEQAMAQTKAAAAPKASSARKAGSSLAKKFLRPDLLPNAPSPSSYTKVKVVSPEKKEPKLVVPVPIIHKTYNPPKPPPGVARRQAAPTVRPPRKTPTPSPPRNLRDGSPSHASPGSSPLKKATRASSPAQGPATSPERAPLMMPRKKKPADIFMKTKKVAR